MATDDHHKHLHAQIAQKVFIEHEGKVLLVKDVKEEERWDFPGGRLHEGEKVLEGLKREVREEIGADIEVRGILATGVYVPNEQFKLFYVIYAAALINPNQELIPEPGEIEKIEWVDKKDLYSRPFVPRGYQEALKDIL